MILTLEVPDSLAQQLRDAAAAQGRDLNNYAVAALQMGLSSESEESDDHLIAALREGIADAKTGRTVTLEEAESRILAGLAARDAQKAA